MLNRLGIRQKLALLLLIPLAAVAITSVPFAVERINDASSAAATAQLANAARDVGQLIQNLQQERLVSLGYLGSPQLSRTALLAHIATSDDLAAKLRQSDATSAIMADVAQQMSALDGVRARILTRMAPAGETYTAYRNVDNALLDALRLGNPAEADAIGLRQLNALEALMRADEEASSVGAILVGSASFSEMNRALITEAAAAQAQYTRQFRSLVSRDQAALLDTVEQGRAAQTIAQMVGDLGQTVTPSTTKVGEALTAAVSYTSLRRVAQDRIAREIATDADGRASTATFAAFSVAAGALLIFIAVVSLGVTVSRSISAPLRRLTRAAALVADLAGAELVRVADSDDPEPGPPKLAAVDVESTDEVGELGAAINRVQATAALMLERQVVTRRNVATMFANIARRTQNLVGRQITLIDELERTARTPELLSRLYRLDHVSTRLRRSADSLLVVSGTVDADVVGTPSALVDVVRSALAEIEGFRSVQLGTICDVTVSAGLVGDLRLILAELLENAASFSPPDTPVVVSATLSDVCRISVVDHGLGMAPEKMVQENLRLIERERLDLAPTTMLGLLVAGRLARRHNLGVRLDHSEGRGVTATVTIPLRLLSATAVPPSNPPRHRAQLQALLEPRVVAPTDGDFDWFSDGRRQLSAAPAAGNGSGPTRVAPQVAGGDGRLPQRRSGPDGAASMSTPAGARESVMDATVIGQTFPAATGRATVPTPDGPSIPNPRYAGGPDGEPPTRGGLTRRVPGSHLAAGIRGDAPAAPPRSGGLEESPTVPLLRDAEAERAALDDFVAGLARGTQTGAGPGPTPPIR
jgi:signal transduction histidine kinase